MLCRHHTSGPTHLGRWFAVVQTNESTENFNLPRQQRPPTSPTGQCTTCTVTAYLPVDVQPVSNFLQRLHYARVPRSVGQRWHVEQKVAVFRHNIDELCANASWVGGCDCGGYVCMRDATKRQGTASLQRIVQSMYMYKRTHVRATATSATAHQPARISVSFSTRHPTKL